MDFMVFLVVILFAMAVMDLIVGVSNDAVNFLNSAIGSRTASFRVIIITAIAGILLGSVFSSGIMEVARKGIFHPEYFTFDKIMWVFLAVMLTDIVLLDVFNSMGLPTSTTVSIVFELLGAAFMTGILFSAEQQESIGEAMKYINLDSTVSIVSGIFLSILIAFSAGVAIQYLCRLLFTFQYEAKLSRFGAPFAGAGITIIIYFLLIKGLKGSTLVPEETVAWVSAHTLSISAVLFVLGTLICLFLQKSARINPLKIVVLAGTFALAMAFAGNDLVNFIGVPIAGFLAYQHWSASGVPADELYQGFLGSNEVIVPNYMLLAAGVIMALTIWLNAKAKKVTQTEVNLGRQDEGEERFRPNAVSRSIVKSSFLVGNLLSVILPKNLVRMYDTSFEKSKIRQATRVQDSPAFDLVRASANLVVASILIAWATSLKLPLSTTYVSFMVAMGTSLADKAWGRDSAVYRVAGVMSVIGGWFITAFIAFAVSGLFALILYKGGIAGTFILLCIVIVYLIFSHINFARKTQREKARSGKFSILEAPDVDLYERNKGLIIGILTELNANYTASLNGLKSRDQGVLQKTNDQLNELAQYGHKLRRKGVRYIKEIHTEDRKSAEIMLHSTDLLQDMIQSSKFLCDENLFYIKNLHRTPDDGFIEISDQLNVKMDAFFKMTIKALKEKDMNGMMDFLRDTRNELRAFINEQLDRQVEVIQQNNLSTKEALLQTNLLLQSRDIQAVLFRIAKMYRKYEKQGNLVPS